MHNPESVLENDTHKILWDFEIQTDNLISAKRPDLVVVNKKREPAGSPQSKIERKRKMR